MKLLNIYITIAINKKLIPKYNILLSVNNILIIDINVIGELVLYNLYISLNVSPVAFNENDNN